MLETIPSQVYAAISFEKGHKPDLKRLKDAFIAEGIFINNKGEQPVIKPVDLYMSMIADNVEAGNILALEERELSNHIEVFGKVAQIRSEYQLTFEGRQGVQVRYGINLFQMIEHNGSWLISSMCWDDYEDKRLLAG